MLKLTHSFIVYIHTVCTQVSYSPDCSCLSFVISEDSIIGDFNIDRAGSGKDDFCGQNISVSLIVL